jgi:hypothetical protein
VKNLFLKFRFWLATSCIRLAIFFIDKSSVEGISFLVAMENWIQWLKETKENGLD